MSTPELRGPEPPANYVDNGCTCSPDVAFNGADLSLACRWHDWLYEVGGDESDRRKADDLFRVNLLLLDCPGPQAMVYFRAVRRFGWSGFKHCRPLRWWTLLWLVPKLDVTSWFD